MHVLITRSQPDADHLSERLHTLGHTTIVEPLIHIVLHDGPALNLRGVQALAFTSANGARAAAMRTHERTLKVVAVGPATAATARALGFQNVSESTGQGVTGLAHHIHQTLTPGKGTLLHSTGTVAAGDLKASLEPFGFAVRRETLYDAHAAEALSGALTAELTAGLVTAAMFFSPRTAALFATLVTNAALAPACRGLVALALSEAVANALAPLAFQRISVATKLTTEAMLEALGAN